MNQKEQRIQGSKQEDSEGSEESKGDWIVFSVRKSKLVCIKTQLQGSLSAC